MRRVQIQLDETTYERLRRQAFQRRRSLAAIIRELLHGGVGAPSRRRRRQEFSFIGAGSAKDPYSVSEEHDRALAEGEW